MQSSKEGFACAINEITVNISHQTLTECEKYGMTWGCDIDCPVLRAGECELQDGENAELYKEIKEEMI